MNAEFLLKKLDETLVSHPSTPRYAAFDADGTLWDIDIGESFFDHQIATKAVPLPSDPWKHYEELKLVDKPAAYLWLAQINAGISISQVRAWAEDAVLKLEPLPFLTEQVRLIEGLKNRSFEIFVVTASVKWAVEPAAQRLGIPIQNVLGIQTAIVGDIVTDQAAGPITFREGKAQAILQSTNGVRPLFCAGNTLGDEHLLKASQGLALAVRSQKHGESLFDSESELQVLAEKHGWLTADYS